MRCPRRRSSLGTTLVETATALVVMAVGILGALTTVLAGSQLGRTTTESRAALQASVLLIDEVRAAPFADLVTTYDGSVRDLDTLVEGAPDGQARISVEEFVTGNTHWPVYRVVVTVEIHGVNGVRTVEMVTLVAERDVDGIPL